ncbi:hypothetical protein Z949_981 [Sulfitobacter guttiformis KCTC 32187]|nr:hypothetical protein Z949_981 [Sulfitobacter guttiformis KCTC 32187]
MSVRASLCRSKYHQLKREFWKNLDPDQPAICASVAIVTLLIAG